MSERPSLGRLVRGHRRAAGLTLEDLAHRSGVSVRTISDMERGRSRRPHVRTLIALADSLGLDDADRRTLLTAPSSAHPLLGPEPAALCQLPTPIPDFTGRAREIAAVSSWLAHRRDAAIPLVLSGPGGVGKTSLAVHRGLASCGDFPDGRLFVDLRGTSIEPLEPYLVQARLLRVLGVPAGDIPDGSRDRSQLLRHLLANRRMLLVLDDAADEAQVRGLLPGQGGTSALITSRRALTGLEHARRIALGPLTGPESAEMLRAVLAAGGKPTEDLARLRPITELCGNYPIALRIAGNRLLSRPGWDPESLVRQLECEDGRLDHLAAGDLRVASAFASSYRSLDSLTRLVFRRLALVPGRDSSARSAAIVSGLPARELTRRLDELAEKSLVSAVPDHRIVLHPLIRLFAREQLRTDDDADAVTEATTRLMSWLLATARAAGLAAQRRATAGPPEFPDPDSARRWLRDEAGSWLGALRHVVGAGDHQAAVGIADALAPIANDMAVQDGWVEVFALAAASAEALGDAGRADRYRRLAPTPAS
ncbi:helix-turn-helix domain-containing protein [Amycolatopsis sp. NPDC049253]|uniref:helix-turn-helix domain-containing protein n=1 Tax=Amycolatopsis sp. NPDC049253 TaxID=3155274 RepID=UPI003415D621